MAEVGFPGPYDGLGPQQMRVVAMRLAGKRWHQIAVTLNISLEELERWRERYPIDQTIRSQAQETLRLSHLTIAGMVPQAIQALRDELTAPDLSGKGKIRIMAARAILDQAHRVKPEPAEGDTRRPYARLSNEQLNALIRKEANARGARN